MTLDEREQDFKCNQDRVRGKVREVKELTVRLTEKQEALDEALGKIESQK